MATALASTPEQGQLVTVRSRPWVVNVVKPSSLPTPDGDDFGMDFRDETDVLLSNLIPKSGRPSRWIYEYDFGDGWRHEVLFEGFPPADPKMKNPLCVEGGIGIFVISTFDTDYLLVKEHDFENAVVALRAAGNSVEL